MGKRECENYLQEKLGFGTVEFSKRVKRPVSTCNTWFRENRNFFDILVDGLLYRKGKK